MATTSKKNKSADKTKVDYIYSIFNKYNTDGNGLIVIFKEKHGDRLFFVKNSSDLGKVALKVFKDRYEQYYRYEIDDLSPPSTETALTREQINSLPNENLKKTALQDLDKYNRILSKYKQDLVFYESIKKAYKENIESLALRILLARQDWEYEGVEIDQPEPCS